MRPIYLDYCSTTPIDPAVVEVIGEYLRRGYPNPSSQHRPGQAARRELERLRSGMVRLLGGQASGMQQDRLVVTSGGSEANHLAIQGLWRAERPQLLVSAVEHPGVIGAAGQAARRGAIVRRIPVDRHGQASLEALERLLAEQPTGLVSLMLVNNETGTIQPVAEAARICHSHGALLHTDAVQAVGHVAVDFRELGVDAMTVAAHKFYGPRGVAALLLRHGLEPAPLMPGGAQQSGIRPGTEDVALVAGMHAALGRRLADWQGDSARIAGLRDSFEQGLSAALPGQMVVNATGAPRSGHVSNIAFPGMNRQAILLAADLVGLAISTGSACASGSSEPSPVLLAMGLEDPLVEGSVRVSFGLPTDREEVAWAVERLGARIRALGREKDGVF